MMTAKRMSQMANSGKLLTACGAILLLLAHVACRRMIPMDLVVEYRHFRAAEKVFDIRQVDQNNNLGEATAEDVDQLLHSKWWSTLSTAVL